MLENNTHKRVVFGQKYQMRVIILYILVDASWSNGGDIPNVSEFKNNKNNTSHPSQGNIFGRRDRNIYFYTGHD